MLKVKAVITVSAPDEDGLWDAHIEYFGKDAANLWEFVADATMASTDGVSGPHYDALVTNFAANGNDAENPFN